MSGSEEADAMARWASSDGMSLEEAAIPRAGTPSPQQHSLPAAPPGYMHAWDPRIQRYVLVPSAGFAEPAPAAYAVRPYESNAPMPGGKVLNFRPQSSMLVKQGASEPYDDFIATVPEIPMPQSPYDAMEGRFDPAIAAELAQAQTDIRTSTPGAPPGFMPLTGKGTDSTGDVVHRGGSGSVRDLGRG